LANVLRSLRPLLPEQGQLRVVFGCGGDRDRSKRPRMAAAAHTDADCLYITSDNPRSEDPASIIADIVAGLPAEHERKPTRVIVDRQAAIMQAVSEATRFDTVLIAGKGHEQGQIFADRTDPFDDVEQAKIEKIFLISDAWMKHVPPGPNARRLKASCIAKIHFV